MTTMFISDTAIKRPVLTVVAMLILVVFGIVALTQLDTDEYPEIDAPVVVVAIPYPGASPDIVEREVIDPIEEVISGISGIDRMRSNSLDSYANIVVEFDFSKDPQVATQEIRDKISAIRNDLPAEMEEPILTQFDPADRPIVSLTLSSPGLTGAELTRMADPDITRRLRGISGVAAVNLVGAIERELVVEIRPRDLEAAGVGVGQLVQALQSQNLAVPVGRLEGSLDERTIRLKGRLDSPADFKQLVVSQTGGRIVRLGDLADVKDATEEPRSYAAYNDEEAVGIDILKSTGFSTTQVANDVRAKVAGTPAELPAGVTLRVVQDGGERVDASVKSVEEALHRRRRAHGGRRVPVPQLVALHGHHGSRVAGVGAGLVRRRVGLRLHAEHHVAARAVARHRHPDRRRHRRAREHRAPRRDGEGSPDGRPRGHRRDRAWRSPRRRCRSWWCSSRLPSSAVWRGSGSSHSASRLPRPCSSRCSSRSRSTRCCRPTGAIGTARCSTRWLLSRWLGHFNLWFDRQAERYKSVIAWALDHRYAMIGLALATFVGALALPAMGIVPAALVPIRTTRCSPSTSSRRRARISNTPRLKAQEVARIARKRPEVAYTYISMGGQGDVVDEGSVFVKLLPKSERSRSQADDRGGHPIRDRHDQRPACRRSAAAATRREADSAADQGTAGRRADTAGAAGGRRGAPGAWRGGRRTSRRRARSRSSTCRSIAAWPVRSASPSARWRRRCGRRLPASTSATGSIRPVRPVTSPFASRPKSRTVVADLESLPLVVSRTRRHHEDDPARAGRAHHAVDWVRRASITSIAIA